MERVVVAAELCLSPERVAELIAATAAHDHPEHVVLDDRSDDDVLDIGIAARVGEHRPEIRPPAIVLWVGHHAQHRRIQEAVQRDGLVHGVLMAVCYHVHGVPGVLEGMLVVVRLNAVVVQRPDVLRHACCHRDRAHAVGGGGPSVVDAPGGVGLREAGRAERVVQPLAQLDSVGWDGLGRVVQTPPHKVRERCTERVHADAALGKLLLQIGAHRVVWMQAHGQAQKHERVVDVHAGVVLDRIVVGLYGSVVLPKDERDDLGANQLAVRAADLDPEEIAHGGHEGGVHEEPERDVAGLRTGERLVQLGGVIRPRDEVAHAADDLLDHCVVIVLGVGLIEGPVVHRLNLPHPGAPCQVPLRAQDVGHQHASLVLDGVLRHFEDEWGAVDEGIPSDELVPGHSEVHIARREGVIPVAALARQIGIAIEVGRGELEPGVARLVVELDLPVPVGLWRHAVVLGHAHTPAEHVPGRGAGLHRVGAGVDDGQPAVLANVGALAEALDPVDAVGDVVGAVGDHLQLERELGIAEQERRLGRSPQPKLNLGLLDEDVQGVGILLHDAKEVHVLPAHLVRGLVGARVLFHVLLGVGRGLDQGDVHVEVVALLDAANQLLDLVLKVLHAFGRHHEVVLHFNGQTVPHGIGGVAPLGLREHARRCLVRHTGGEALVVTVGVPLDLGIRVLDVLVGQDDGGEWGIGRVSDEPVDAVREVCVGPLEHIGQVPPLVTLVALLVCLDIATRWAEDVLPVTDLRLEAVAGVRAAAVDAGIPVAREVTGCCNRAK